eukprot:3642641-Alexandrium_andersonii.AAC.1
MGVRAVLPPSRLSTGASGREASIRNPQSAPIRLLESANCFRRSNLELRRPRKGFKTGSRSFRVVRSAPSPAKIPNLPTKAGLEG